MLRAEPVTPVGALTVPHPGSLVLQHQPGMLLSRERWGLLCAAAPQPPGAPTLSPPSPSGHPSAPGTPQGRLAWVAGSKGLRSEVPLCSQHLAGEGAMEQSFSETPRRQRGAGRGEQAEERAGERQGSGGSGQGSGQVRHSAVGAAGATMGRGGGGLRTGF